MASLASCRRLVTCGRVACSRWVSTVCSGDDVAFARVVRNRSSARSFDASRAIPKDVLAEIVALTLVSRVRIKNTGCLRDCMCTNVVQRSPSSYNLQPYRLICVQDASARARLSQAMLGGGNIARVASAPLLAVFASNLDPLTRVDELVQLEKHAGKPPSYLTRIHTHAATLAQPHAPAAAAASTLFRVLSVVAPMPTVNSIEAWSFKSTMLAVQTFLLAATSAGLSSHAMEGFDISHVRAALRIPSSYSVPVVVAVGYPTQSSTVASASPRFPARTMVTTDSFDASPDSIELADAVQRRM